VSDLRRFSRRPVARVIGAAIVATLLASARARAPHASWAAGSSGADTAGSLSRLKEAMRPGHSKGSGVAVYVVDSGVNDVGIFESLDNGYPAVGLNTADCGRNHGTYVASLIAGKGYGLAESARIVPVKVLDCDGSGSMRAVIDGLSWVLAHAQPQTSVVNLSFGGKQNKDIDRIVTRLSDRGMPVVIAAGNSAIDTDQMSPARTGCAKDLSIVVAAATEAGSPWTSSNFGACVSIYAPGTRVYAYGSDGEKLVTGTSFAAPSVAGAIAAYASTYGVTTADAWHLVLEQSSRSLKSGKRTDTTARLLDVLTAP
jgi:subtilisin family serine protease